MVRDEDFRVAGALAEDTEKGIIDQVRSTRESEIAALFSEKRGTVRVSLRSTGHVDVAAVARGFSGGGHIKAAGLTFPGPLDDAIRQVLAALEEALEGVAE